MPHVIKPIPGFPGYLIGSDGKPYSRWRLRRRARGGRGTESYISGHLKELKTGRDPKGYARVQLRKEGKYHPFLVHHLVLFTFVGPCPEGMECLHGDGDKRNNKRSNLRWGTREENIADSIKHGTFYNATKAAAEVNRGKKRIFTPEWKAKMSESAKRRWAKDRR